VESPLARCRRSSEQLTVLAIFGPTGVGKTGVAVELARLLRERGEEPVAINCDALQVYKGLDVLTGAATETEREVLPHELLGIVPVTADFSIHQYMPLAHAAIDRALETGRTPIVVGGTGLYLRAALADLSLRKVPAFDQESELWSGVTRHPTQIFGLDMDRVELYARIDARVDAIVAAGGQEEARRADALDAGRTARKALGLNELLAGDLETMKRRSRNYARRQLTWMRKIPDLTTIDRTTLTDNDTAMLMGRKAAI
jgi:tRNA dimethylallyltransferase